MARKLGQNNVPFGDLAFFQPYMSLQCVVLKLYFACVLTVYM